MSATPSVSESTKRSVLVLNADEDLFAKIAPILDRDEFEVNRFPRAAMALELISVVAFDVLVVRYPLPDIEAQEFLNALRGPESACRRTPLLLLAAEDDYEHACDYVGRGANRVVSVAESAERLQAEIGGLLDVAQRYQLKVIVRLEIETDGRKELAICQTENISETGMLLTGAKAYDLETSVSFEFILDGDTTAVRGEGVVSRHTTTGREAARGVGLRFISFDRDGLERLRQHLHQEWGAVDA